eukprot:TRINITY_DN14880_c0_g1_i4.p2 TRINITY_DN14880_c0_g1~~TRINITY_DN14880_c0_g1_i4.p2  ORF type:complete len:201 (-),score=-20.84 TRINITY_DN14880_c0_g1_i4:528-1130(-)
MLEYFSQLQQQQYLYQRLYRYQQNRILLIIVPKTSLLTITNAFSILQIQSEIMKIVGVNRGSLFKRTIYLIKYGYQTVKLIKCLQMQNHHKLFSICRDSYIEYRKRYYIVLPVSLGHYFWDNNFYEMKILILQRSLLTLNFQTQQVRKDYENNQFQPTMGFSLKSQLQLKSKPFNNKLYSSKCLSHLKLWKYVKNAGRLK